MELLSEANVDAVVFLNLQGIVRAAHAYYDARGVLPPAAVPNLDLPPNKRLSGLVLLLPYFDRATELWQGKEKELYDEATRKLARELYQSIDLKKAWDDPVNLPATRTLLPALLVPNSVAPLRDEAGNALSHFAFVRGHAGEDDGAFTDDTTVTILGWARGRSNTSIPPTIRENNGETGVFSPEGLVGSLAHCRGCGRPLPVPSAKDVPSAVMPQGPGGDAGTALGSPIGPPSDPTAP